MVRKILSAAVLCIAAIMCSCSDSEGNGDEKWFQTPVVEVSGSIVTVGCRTGFAESVLATADAGFAYAPVEAGSAGNFVQTNDVTVEGNLLSGLLTGLEAETTYLVYAYVALGVDFRLQSAPVMFRSGPDPVLPDEPVFGQPNYADVTASSALISGSFEYKGDKTISEAYFMYGEPSDDGQRVAVTTSPGEKSARLTGLKASTTYNFRLMIVADGKTYGGKVGTFTTLAQGGQGGTKYSGWAELPAVEERPDDYYFAAHYCDGAPGGRNYSVCYSKQMRGAVWVAYPMHVCYTKGDAGGQNKDWKYDPAIPSFVQPDLSSSYKDSGDGSFSRGHMLASNDRQSSKATNKQTFYYTNMSPQIQNGFNGAIWATLEKNCHEMICSDTLYMVTGAWFGDETTTCNDNKGNTVVVPTHYYKVLIRSHSGNTGKPLWELPAEEIECAGYWFEHKAYSGAKPSQFIKSVAWIEQQTQQTFFINVPNAPKEELDVSFWSI